MLNRKFADLRHSPSLDPRLESYTPGLLPVSIVRFGPRARHKIKGGVRLAEPGFSAGVFLWPGRWYALVSIRDAAGRWVADHVDIARPPEERDGMWSFLDLKLDLILPATGDAVWVDQDHYAAERAQGSISDEWDAQVRRSVADIDRLRAAGAFPPPEVQRFRSGP